jgi:hypothetical protein
MVFSGDASLTAPEEEVTEDGQTAENIVGKEEEKKESADVSEGDVLSSSAVMGWSQGVAASQDLLDRCGITVGDIVNRTVCSSLEKYRQSIGFSVPQRQADLFAGLASVACDDTSLNRLTLDIAAASQGGSTAQYLASTPLDTLDDFAADGPECYSDDEDDDMGMAGEGFSGETSPSHSSSLSPSHNNKIQWDEVFSEAGSVMGDDDAASVASHRSSIGGAWGESSYGYSLQRQATNVSLSVADIVPIGGAGSYAPSKRSNAASATFLATMQMGGGKAGANQWAGARHWKRGMRKRTAPTPSKQNAAGTTSKNEATAGKTKKRQTKEKFRFDFSTSTEGISEQIDNCPNVPSVADGTKKGKASSDPTTMTAASIQKNITSAKSGVYLLPEDAKINVKDLCRYCLKRVVNVTNA